MEEPYPEPTCSLSKGLSNLSGNYMGAAEPHRRKPGQTSAFAMLADIRCPFKVGTDLGVSKRRKARYALIATIPVPKWPSPEERGSAVAETVEVPLECIAFQQMLWKV